MMNLFFVFLFAFLPPVRGLEFAHERNDSIRREIHNLIFSNQNDNRRREHDDVLREYVVFRSENKELQLDYQLMEDASVVAPFFDLVVFRGEKLGEVKTVEITIGKDSFVSKPIKTGRGEVTIRLGRTRLDRKSKVMIASLGEVAVEEICFVTNGISNNIEKFIEFRNEYPKNLKLSKSVQIDRAFATVIANQSLEDLLESMDENSAAFSSVIFPAQLTSGLDAVGMRSILADRRVAKLYEILSEMDTGEASEIASNAFDEQFASFKKSWADTSITAARHRYAMEANLFLCSKFCRSEEVLEKIDQWSRWYSDEAKTRGFSFKKLASPQFHFTSNVYQNLLIEQKRMTINEAYSYLGQFSESVGGSYPKIGIEPLPVSDWTPNQVEILEFVPVLPTPPNISRRMQQRFLEELRKQIRPLD